ncbi:MAG TPA: hypothetical protein VN908_11525 [Gemmatimonadales bacterium]|nr:hypothetical protein [Gemmatimonadales bacterium]
MSDPAAARQFPKALGQRFLQLLLLGWLACLVLTVAAGFTLGENVMFDLLSLLLLLSVALVAAPAVLFLAYAERHGPAAVPREMRRSAIGSGLSGLFAAAVLWSFPRPALLFMVPGAVLAALAALVIIRALRLAPPDAIAGAPPLRHRGATITGVVTIVLFVILAAKL